LIVDASSSVSRKRPREEVYAAAPDAAVASADHGSSSYRSNGNELDKKNHAISTLIQHGPTKHAKSMVSVQDNDALVLETKDNDNTQADKQKNNFTSASFFSPASTDSLGASSALNDHNNNNDTGDRGQDVVNSTPRMDDNDESVSSVQKRWRGKTWKKCMD
jgi:hypothetical protein